MMNFHTFPNTDLSVSQLCFGCWGVASDFHWGDRVEDESVKAMLAAIDAGVNFFDTAPVYGDGASETLLGKVLSANGLREKVVIASKARPDQMKPDEIQAGCEASLARLQTDCIDLFQTHWTNREVPLEDTWGAMRKLQEQGKVRHIGVCNAGVEDLATIAPLQNPLSNQLPYNLIWRMIENAILPKCIGNKIGVLVYSPLMHGMLAGNYKAAAEVPDGRARSRHFTTERALARHGEPGCEAETFSALDSIRDICQELGRSMADVALAWTIQQPGVVSVIAGARNDQQLLENVKVLENPLPADAVQKLGAATDALLAALGSNPDMWDGGENARYR
ncbi:MAG: aryl-alcohol dehydrogenase-like predicted oxidoreductase [Verrucomicrobiales bacterium]|jgi:aryl-alcohol dehydrogenase-like predicted oxidoreductase